VASKRAKKKRQSNPAPPSKNTLRINSPLLPTSTQNQTSEPARAVNPTHPEQATSLASPGSQGIEHHPPVESSGLPGIYELPVWPWSKCPKRKPAIPPEQAERWATIRLVCRLFREYVWLLIPTNPSQRVASAVVSVLGVTDDVKREFPDVGVNSLWLAPKPELEPTGRTLIQIWCIVQLIDVNFTSFPYLAHSRFDRRIVQHAFASRNGAPTYCCPFVR